MPPKKVFLTEPSQLDGALRVALRVGSLVDRLLGNCFFMLPQPDVAWMDANLEDVEIKGPLVAPRTDATTPADREIALALYHKLRGFVANKPLVVLLTDRDQPLPAQRALTIQSPAQRTNEGLSDGVVSLLRFFFFEPVKSCAAGV
jgi:hypothetical protein